MEEDHIKKFVNKTWRREDFASIFFTSLVSILIILLIVFAFVWHYRGAVFGYFAREYLNQEEVNKIGAEMAVKQQIFSQDSFVIDAVKKTNPAVVSIIISKEVPKYETYVDPN